MADKMYYGTGRRKKSIARVYLKKGKIESIHFVLDHEEV